jgi:hypothetical protein
MYAADGGVLLLRRRRTKKYKRPAIRRIRKRPPTTPPTMAPTLRALAGPDSRVTSPGGALLPAPLVADGPIPNGSSLGFGTFGLLESPEESDGVMIDEVDESDWERPVDLASLADESAWVAESLSDETADEVVALRAVVITELVWPGGEVDPGAAGDEGAGCWAGGCGVGVDSSRRPSLLRRSMENASEFYKQVQ